ncbi:hypothetical protein [Urbifossiella limnaea]|uniref:Uncharacterized protein n=1 Tax=Urbifossiella limnaea TaxID=2528023 RepID=A0A517XSQ6_9BACT|nr:hypothetical protein [Urbifossiella limnaea]QDU20546.1 hypothetical protein ETAA1_25010 [Urbifossiella limnaea]
MFPVILVAALVWPQAIPWRAVGRAEAERDIALGTMKLKIYGHMAGLREVDEVAGRNLRAQLGLELRAVDQCLVPSYLVELTDGYNDRIQEEVEARHGIGAIDEVWANSVRESQPELVAHDWLLRVVTGVGLVILFAFRRVLLPASWSRTVPRATS